MKHNKVWRGQSDCVALLSSGLLIASMLSRKVYAADYSNTIGSTFSSASESLNPLMALLLAVCVVLGLILTGMGLNTLRGAGTPHMASDHKYSFARGAAQLIFGALVLAVPDTMNCGLLTLMGSGTGYYAEGVSKNVGTVSTCLTQSDDASTVACIAGNVARNVVPVGSTFIMTLGVLVGFFVIVKAFVKHATNEGGRSSRGTLIGQIIIGIVCANLSGAIAILGNTLGYKGSIMSSSGTELADGSVPADLLYTPDSSVAILKEFGDSISSILVILSMFGLIAFVRGIARLYAVSEGQGGHKEVFGGIVFMVMGVVAVNIKATICLGVRTFVGGTGLGFCS